MIQRRKNIIFRRNSFLRVWNNNFFYIIKQKGKLYFIMCNKQCNLAKWVITNIFQMYFGVRPAGKNISIKCIRVEVTNRKSLISDYIRNLALKSKIFENKKNWALDEYFKNVYLVNFLYYVVNLTLFWKIEISLNTYKIVY